MKRGLKNLFILLLVVPVMSVAQNPFNDPLVRAMMDAYAEQIEENPQDYFPYFARGKEYYNYGYYNEAFADLCQAIKYFPEKETADLSQAHTLRALIYQERGDQVSALDDFNKALQLNPSSFYALMMRADLLCKMGDYEHARGDYQMMLRQDPRSQEAYLGLARVSYKENNMGVCNDYLVKAQNANPTNAQFYVERGDLYEEMKEPQKAADDYVTAILYGENKGSVRALTRLSRTAYKEVVNSLTTAIDVSEDKGFFYFIRANINMSNHHYSESIKDWNVIVEQNYLYYHSVFFNRGYCYMRLGQFEYAVEDMSRAINLKNNKISYFIGRSRVYRVMGQFDKAQEDLAMAATFDPSNVELLQEKGLLAVEQGEYEKATEYYNEAIMYNADDAMSYLLRADNYLRMNDEEAAMRNYELVLSVADNTEWKSLQGYALARMGRTSEAEAWMEQLLSNTASVGAEDYFHAACLYAQTANKVEAYKYLEKSFKSGYGDYYNVYFYTDSPVSMAPLRNEVDFRDLVKGYSDIF